MIVKEVLDHISLHPGVTREEIHETIIEKKKLLETNKTFHPVTWLDGLIDGLIEMKVIIADYSNDSEPIAYGLAPLYLSQNIAYLYGMAYGTKSQVVKLNCPGCGLENLVNPLVHIGREKKCRGCGTVLFPSRLLKEPQSEARLDSEYDDLKETEKIVPVVEKTIFSIPIALVEKPKKTRKKKGD